MAERFLGGFAGSAPATGAALQALIAALFPTGFLACTAIQSLLNLSDQKYVLIALSPGLLHNKRAAGVRKTPRTALPQ